MPGAGRLERGVAPVAGGPLGFGHRAATFGPRWLRPRQADVWRQPRTGRPWAARNRPRENYNPQDHFVETDEMVLIGSGAQRERVRHKRKKARPA